MAKKYYPQKRYYSQKYKKKRGYRFTKAAYRLHTPIEVAEDNPDFYSVCANYLKTNLDTTLNRKMLKSMVAWLGVPYVYGGASKFGTDCSGFVLNIYKEAYDIKLSHGGASMLSQMSKIIKRNQPLEFGDILFFRQGRHISHVGIYLGNNMFIHAASHRRGVVVDNLKSAYFWNRFMVAGKPHLPVISSQN